MFRNIKNKILLFIEPCLSAELFVHKAQMKGYKTFIISAKDTYLTLPDKNFTNRSAFFQIDTHNEEAVLNLVAQLAQKFHIEGVIPGYEYFGPLTAKVANFLKKPGLSPEIALSISRKGIFQTNLQKRGYVEICSAAQDYLIEGMIKNKIVHIFIFTENILLSELNNIDLGYIVRSKIDQIHFKIINSYIQDVVSTFKLDYGFFHATVKVLKNAPSLSKFMMGLAKDFMPTLINYATGINYYDRVFELFSNQPVSFHRTKKLNAGIIFFYKNSMKKRNLSNYIRELSYNPAVQEAKEYCKIDGYPYQLSAEPEKIGHAIIIHHDYKILKQHIKEISKKAGFLL